VGEGKNLGPLFLKRSIMNKTAKLFFVLLLPLVAGGCSVTLNIKEAPSAYSMPLQKGASKIVMGDLEDRRPDKTNVGIIGSLVLKTKKDINVLLTDRIAVKLRNEGFNIQKVNVASGGKNEIKIILNENKGAIYFTGYITSFSVQSFDAIMERANGTSIFIIKIYSRGGTVKFEKQYISQAENWIGFTGASGGAKTVEKTLTESVNTLFKDAEFLNFLKDLKK